MLVWPTDFLMLELLPVTRLAFLAAISRDETSGALHQLIWGENSGTVVAYRIHIPKDNG